MRQSKLKREEINELDEFKRQESRKSGFSLMSVRDRGWGRVGGSDVVLEWHVPRDKRPAGVPYRNVPTGMVVLHIGKESALINVEDLLKLTRWA